MSWFLDEIIELSEEEVDEIILETAKKIMKYGMEMPAIMALESFKPLMYVGGELTRLTLSPFFPIFGSNVDMWGQKLIYVFEEKKNVDKLIRVLEKLSRGEEIKASKDRNDSISEQEPKNEKDES
jgi:hypothetical protein